MVESQRKSKSKKESVMGISDRIEAFICQLIKNDDGWVELGRNELAGIFNCVPSQINYVMRTRFTPERGYVIESRRGGGGYIKIRRISVDAEDILSVIPDKLTETGTKKIIKLALDSGIFDERAATLAFAAVSEASLDETQKASVMKSMIKALM
ncbi:MAG: CtsR family transcriptional regulator [Clostridia bacterium]|nr:CtsR family transcriptional regulator [Clostridia bacterium]